MSDTPNISPVTEANFSPVTGAHLPPSRPSTSPSPPRPSRIEPRGRDGLLSPAWPIGIALALAGLVYYWRSAGSSGAGPVPGRAPLVARAVKALTPRASETERGEARWKAQALASPGDWLFSVLDHHRDIEGAFGAAAIAAPGAARAASLRTLATLLMGHSIAEEAVLYPALAAAGETARATMAYGEQALTKTEMAALQDIDPESDAFPEKLGEIRQAVLHHMYQEEATWFPLLKERLSEADQALLTQRFLEEFRRYTRPV